MKTLLVSLLASCLLAAPAGALAQAPSPAAAPAPASADAQPGTDDLEALLGESVVTTASRAAERASIAPATVFNITADEIHRSGMRTVDEALEFLGLGIYVSKPRDYAGGIDVGAQGVLLRQSRHVLVMLDGAILNSQGTGRISLHEGLGIPMDFIDHIEVMLGPGSVIYGSNAMLAVINIITRRARNLSKPFVSGELGIAAAQDADGNPTSGGDAHMGLRSRVALGFGHKFTLGGHEGEVSAMGEWAHEESATYGVTPFTMGQPNNQSFLPGQTTWGGTASHRMDAPSGALTLRMGDFHLMLSGFYYSRGMPLVGTFNDPYALEEQSGLRGDLGHSWAINQRFSLDSRLYGGYSGYSEQSNYGETFWCLPGQPLGCHFRESARSIWFGLEQRLTFDWWKSGKVVTLLGYDVRLRLFDSHPADYTDRLTDALPTLPLPAPSDTSALGAVFLQQVIRPWSFLALNLGGRLDIASPFGVHFSPRAAVVLTPGSTTVLRLSYNEAFRAPSQHELTEFDPTYRITPLNLNPETVRSVEFEGQQRLWRLQVGLRGYYAHYDGLIDSRTATADEIAHFTDRLSPGIDPTVIVVNDNLGDLNVYGGSAALSLRLPRGVSLFGTVNYSHAEDGMGNDAQKLPSVFGNFRATWQGESGYALSLSGVYTGPRAILNASAPTGFTLGPRLDLRLAASGPFAGLPDLKFRATIGFDVNPLLPYAVAVGTDTPSTYVLYPDQPRLFGFFGLVYTPSH